MTIIVEDGTRVANANSYVSEADFESFAATRGVTLSSTAELLLIQAMDYIEAQSFTGSKSSSTQTLQWPRNDVYIDGYAIASDAIPLELTKAQQLTALAINNGFDPLAVATPSIKREKVDVLETEYQDGAMATSFDPRINAALKKLTVGGSTGGLNFVVSRA